LFDDTINKIAEDDADAIYEIAEDDAEELFHSNNICTNHDYRIGESCFLRQLKLIWQSQKIKVKKIKSASEKEESTFKQVFKHCVFASCTF
jgi:hypothetical protein